MKTPPTEKQASWTPEAPERSSRDGSSADPSSPDLQGVRALQRTLGNRALRAMMSGGDGPPVQAKPALGAARAGAAVFRAAAELGVSGGGGPLPYRGAIQRAFGRHDLSGVRAHVGAAAEQGARALGATAFTMGEHVAFGGAPDLHTTAHEAAHVIQQRGGARVPGGLGRAGDHYERHADAVADRVSRGRSAEALLDQVAGGGGPRGAPPAVQLSREGNLKYREQRLAELFTDQLIEEKRQILHARMVEVQKRHPGVLVGVDPGHMLVGVFERVRAHLSQVMGEEDKLALSDAEYRAAFDSELDDIADQLRLPTPEQIEERLATLREAGEVGLDISAEVALAPRALFEKRVRAPLAQAHQEIDERDSQRNLEHQSKVIQEIHARDEKDFVARLLASWKDQGEEHRGQLVAYAHEIFHQTIRRAVRHLQAIPIHQIEASYRERVAAFMDRELPVLFEAPSAPRMLDSTNYPDAGVNAGVSVGALDKHFAPMKPTYVGFINEAERHRALRAVAGLPLSPNIERRMVVPGSPVLGPPLLLRVYGGSSGIVVEVVSRNAPSVPTGAEVSAAVLQERLCQQYQLGPFQQQDAPWTAPDLERLAHALGMIPVDDRVALRGLSFVRVHAIESGQSQQDKRIAGRFRSGKKERAIDVTDMALRSDGQIFSLPGPQNAVPTGQRTILHEIGHAVERQAELDAIERFNAGVDEYNQLADGHDATDARAGKIWDEFRAQAQEYEAQHRVAALFADEAEAVGVVGRAVRQATELFNAVKADPEADDGAFRAAFDAAVALEGEQPKLVAILRRLGSLLADWQTARRELSSLRQRVDQKNIQVDALERERKAAVRSRDALRTAPSASGASDKTVSARLFDFVTFCRKHQIAPTVTDYARTSFDAENYGELYAESYSIFLADRDFLELNYPMLFLYFSRGMHLG